MLNILTPLCDQQKSVVPLPLTRKLRVYAFDPSLNLRTDTAFINQITAKVKWEKLEPGPIGEYIEVIDVDPASKCYYKPVDLDDPSILAQDGIAPSDGLPSFHQQMVYAVSMLTIKNFENALGRVILWSDHRPVVDGHLGYYKEYNKAFVRKLRIYPHALREANAYYSSQKKALLFGYFPSTSDRYGNTFAGMVYTCLSFDIISHEITHALVDGIHPYFSEPTNPDVYAFHEAFADIMAIFQRFSYPEVLEHQIALTRGDLESQNILGQLAQQFGEAIGQRSALRDAIGEIDPETGWHPRRPEPADIDRVSEPHERGSILLAAVFEAFLTIYKKRVADLIRISTEGTGVLRQGAIHPDLVQRLAREAAKSAQHVLQMCIRALDYCPPLDITFGEYLRAIVTADFDVFPEDMYGYRVAFIEAFRRRGIFPRDVRTLSEEELKWDPPGFTVPDDFTQTLSKLVKDWSLTGNREKVHEIAWKKRVELYYQLNSVANLSRGHLKQQEDKVTSDARLVEETRQKVLEEMGLHREAPIIVHSIRPARRCGQGCDLKIDLVIELTQTLYIDKKNPKLSYAEKQEGTFPFHGGCSLIVDMSDDCEQRIRYCIKKPGVSINRRKRQIEFMEESSGSLAALYLEGVSDRLNTSGYEPFANLHRYEV